MKVLLLFCLLAGIATAKPKTCGACGPNEQAVGCQPCSQRCADRADPMMCTMDCKFGNYCECKSGYLRDNNNKCVPEDECPEECGPNEEPTTCEPCSQKCADRADPVVCTMECKFGNYCRCKSGYLRDNNNKCVPENECPEECGPNEEPTTCEPCSQKCADRAKPVPCPKICKFGNYCRCKSGYLRDKNNKCVPEKECRD